MTIADQARNLAISLEAKKDALSQRQSGDWKVSFTVQGIDMDARLTQAPMGTRYAVVLVEIGDDEMPKQPAKESNRTPSPTTAPQPEIQPRPAGVVKRAWVDFQPAQQAGMRSNDARFNNFLQSEYPAEWREFQSAADCIRSICGVHSRVELGTDQRKRVLWHQLDSRFQAWLLKEQVGA